MCSIEREVIVAEGLARRGARLEVESHWCALLCAVMADGIRASMDTVERRVVCIPPLLSIVNIVGARPNLVKMAAVLAAQRARPDVFTPLLVHTRQHDSPAMSDRLFAELELPPPDIALASGGDGQAAEIGPMVSQL